MARHTIHLAPFSPNEADTGFSGQITPSTTLARHIAKTWRDAMRAKFTANSALHDTTGYTVSDLFVWAGSSSHEGVGFIVRDNPGGVEWVFCLAENTATAFGATIDYVLGGSGTTMRTHTRFMGQTSHSSSTSSSWAVYFNPDIATNTAADDINFDVTDALTFSGGDFTTSGVEFNTAPNLAKLRPAHAPYGLQTPSGLPWVRACVTFDDVRASALLLVETGAAGAFCFGVMGLCCDPNDGADTNTALTWHHNVSWSAGELVVGNGEAYAFDVGGTLRDYDLDTSGDSFGLDDALIDEGGTDKADWRVIQLINGTGGAGTKGTLMEQIAVRIGPEAGHDHGRPYKLFDDDNTLVKYTARYAFMHEANTLFFPAPIALGLKTLSDV